MQNDLEEIKQLFFEESDEGLDSMESALLNLTEGEADSELINDIFRGAHSIKGCAATFGFNEIAEFTHQAETLLDEMRSGQRSVTRNCIDLLLQGVDCIREMMGSAHQGEDFASEHTISIRRQIEKVLAEKCDLSQDAVSTESVAVDSPEKIVETTTASTVAGVEGWIIQFKPHRDFLKYGNNPLLIFRELSELGELSAKSALDDLPDFAAIDPFDCYVSWVLEINGHVERCDIESVFEWVDDSCDLVFTPMGETVEAEEHDAIEELTKSNAEIAEGAVGGEKMSESSNNNKSSEAVLSEKESSENKVPPKSSPQKKAPPSKPAGSIRVGIDKIDALLNLVGELVITQSMLKKVGGEISGGVNEKLDAGLAQLEANARELQEVTMKMRMLPINNTFSRFPRMVHDLSQQLNKQVNLEITGEHTELDKTVLEKIADPLVHLVRNALDHGIESPEARLEAGKPECGTMRLSAAHEAGNIVISISDDGAGINSEKVLAIARERGVVSDNEVLTHDEINHLIFRPGFSTAEVVSDVSGRGVGMDVVRRNIQDLGGRVEVKSTYKQGSVFTIRLPLTLAILDGQLVQAGNCTYVVPLLSIVESVLINKTKVSHVGDSAYVYRLREQNIPIVDTSCVLRTQEDYDLEPVENGEFMRSLDGKILVIVDLGNDRAGLIVDTLLDQQQVVIKSLESNFRQIDGLSGATILGDGEVALILDLSGLVNQCYRQRGKTKNLSQTKVLAA